MSWATTSPFRVNLCERFWRRKSSQLPSIQRTLVFSQKCATAMLWIFRYAFPEGRLDKPKSKLIAILEYRRDVFVINNVSKHKQQYIPRSVLCRVCAMLPQSPQVQQRREYKNNSLPWTYGHTVAASIKEEKTAHKASYPSQSTILHPLPFLGVVINKRSQITVVAIATVMR